MNGKLQGRLVRSDSNRLLTGVCGGMAAFLGIDATIVRIAFVVFALLGGGVFVYILAWLLMPAEGERHSLLEQIIRNFQGKPSET
ncbi:PspC domain-containing protein [Nocardiopsis sp. EMB25]|uniref:PspC domain-containing protein n=1 Tax=Nocardiopsis TaxID=2013 RepID=UPI00034D6BC3|nr:MULTISPECIES: PspC domain-containing protein [Nocardiopsis]MCY9787079.1 PspC domain-containing protein [Nocardiopsis sp. EMB25]